MTLCFTGLITKIERRRPVIRGRKEGDVAVLERGPEEACIIFSNHLSIKLDPHVLDMIGWQEGDEIEFTGRRKEPPQ